MESPCPTIRGKTGESTRNTRATRFSTALVVLLANRKTPHSIGLKPMYI
jgi:hypothetical protein